MSKKKFKQILALISLGIIINFIVGSFSFIWQAIGFVFIVAMPFIIGFCIAFLINKPYMFFAETMFKDLEKSKVKFFRQIRKPMSLILAYIITFGIIVFLIGIIVPQLIESFNKLSGNFSSYAETFKKWIFDIAERVLHIELKQDNDLFTMVNNLVKIITGEELRGYVTGLANKFGPDLFDTAIQFTTNIYNISMGIVISFYFLACKEKLIYQTKKFTVAFMPEKSLPKIFEIAELSNKMFGRYVYGRIVDSMIMGMMCFVGMSIFKFDYSLLISVVIGITNVIPLFGPAIGAIPSIIILLIVNPVEALWFSIFIFTLQQIDGNLIGPKVVGNSIGISGFWIMASVIIGGGLFSIVGMFIAVPVFAIIYVLVGGEVDKRLKEKNYLHKLGSSPENDIITDAEKPTIDFNDIKFYRNLKDNVMHSSKKEAYDDKDNDDFSNFDL